MEIRRVLRTTKILELALSPENYHLFRGKRFFKTHFRDLYKILDIDVFGENEEIMEENIQEDGIENVLVYPSETSIPISELSPSKKYRIIFIDGTWAQARTMYNSNPILHSMKAVRIDQSLLENTTSKYVIRTQPKDICVSTVEAVALVLGQLEGRPEIYDLLTEPLKMICDFQLENGAVEHHSKEYQIANGLYKKQVNNGMIRKEKEKE